MSTMAIRPLISPVLICSTVRPMAPGNAGDDAAQDDHRDAVAHAALGDLLTQPHEEHGARRHGDRRRRTGTASPGVTTMPCACRPLAVTNDWNSARPSVP